MLSITIYSTIYYITIYNPRPRALLLLGGLESNNSNYSTLYRVVIRYIRLDF